MASVRHRDDARGRQSLSSVLNATAHGRNRIRRAMNYRHGDVRERRTLDRDARNPSVVPPRSKCGRRQLAPTTESAWRSPPPSGGGPFNAKRPRTLIAARAGRPEATAHRRGHSTMQREAQRTRSRRSDAADDRNASHPPLLKAAILSIFTHRFQAAPSRVSLARSAGRKTL